MLFTPNTHPAAAAIGTVTLGAGDGAIVIGGSQALPFYTFDAPTPHPPVVGVEITDLGPAIWPQPGLQAFYTGCKTAAQMAARAQQMAGASFVALRFAGADPSGHNRSVDQCVAAARQTAQAIACPLVLLGCGHGEKDAALLPALAEALAGQRVALLSAREENYRAISAAAARYGQVTGAESSVDINLAKQLNAILGQAGSQPEDLVQQPGAAAAGYGLEYLLSTLDRIRAAALQQGDRQLMMPIITPVSQEAWSVKEATAPQAEIPAWGDAEARGVGMEITTAAACLASGSDAVILRHPDAVSTVAQMIRALV